MSKRCRLAFSLCLALVSTPAADGEPLPPRVLPWRDTVRTSADGKLVASLADGNAVVVRETATGRERFRLEGHSAPAVVVAFSPDGKTLASGSQDRTVRIWDLATGKPGVLMPGHEGTVHSLAFSPDGKFLASGGDDQTVRLWNVASGKEILVLHGHRGAVRGLAFTPDGKLLASGGDDQTLRLWELASGQKVLQLGGAEEPGVPSTFEPDGRTLLTLDVGDFTVRRWDIITGKLAGKQTVTRLEIEPAELALSKGKQAALRVRAHWSNGAVQEVTPWAVCEALDPEMIAVAGGRIDARLPGRTAVTVRYLGRSAAVLVTVPDAALKDYPKVASNNFVDELLLAEWQKVGWVPPEVAGDTVFLRRVYLDLLGTLPTPDEARQFIASHDADKRPKLITALLERPDFVDYWTQEWGSLLGARDAALGEKERTRFQAWVRQAVKDNWPLDRVARELLLAQGEFETNGAVGFYLANKTPEMLAETTAQAFLGTNLRCARCHHHPYEGWGKDAYFGLAAFFARLERQRDRPAVRLAPSGKLTHPLSGKVVAPRLPGQDAAELGAGDPREALAQRLTRLDDRALARAIVNRYWTYLFGRGLVELGDSPWSTHLSLHPGLLDALAQDLVKHDYDVQYLLRLLCGTRFYQQVAESPTVRETRFFISRRMQRLSGIQFTRVLRQACAVKAAALPDEVSDELTDAGCAAFSRRQHNGPDLGECERQPVDDAPLVRMLHALNSDRLLKVLTDPEGRVARLLAAKEKDEKIVEELVLATLSRLPTEKERPAALEHLSRKGTTPQERKTAAEDILWALVNTKEFLRRP